MSDFSASRHTLERALFDPALGTEAHYLLWEVCQACGDRDAALDHLVKATRINPLRTRLPTPGIAPVRSVLALNVPGDFQANLPLPMLLDSSTTLHTLWLTGVLPPKLPPIDCVFIAVAEDERHRDALTTADALAATLGRPVINNGALIASLSRTGASAILAGLPTAIVPPHTARSRFELAAVPMPFIVRPACSHAGRELALIRSPRELQAYLARPTLADAFTTAPFIDYRSADGMFRKCRIVFVDGQPYPVHLAIHHDWAIWYYNAGMAESETKQSEEARFLGGLSTYAGPSAMDALNQIASRIGLDYFGLDCAIMPDGRLLVFEIETGMIVHDHDPQPYKQAAAHRVLRAVENLLDQRIATASRPAVRPPHPAAVAAR